MATQGHIDQLNSICKSIDEVDRSQLLRPDLGRESLQKELEPRLQGIDKIKNLTLEYASGVGDSPLSNLNNILQQILNELQAQAGRNSSQYIASKDAFLRNIDTHLEKTKDYRAPFVAAAIESRGFLEDAGIRKEYQRTVTDLKTEATKTIDKLKIESAKAIEEARDLAKEIEERARRTAAKISVEEAQKQFKEAQKSIRSNLIIWGVVSAAAVAAFIWTAVHFLKIGPPANETWHVVYYTAIRITILVAVGAIATFCMRVFRAYMHMNQLNLHRQRVANSIEAFVVSAQTPEQRDVILSNLVEAVVAFGNSGLLPNDEDSIGSQKLSTDVLSRILNLLTPKK